MSPTAMSIMERFNDSDKKLRMVSDHSRIVERMQAKHGLETMCMRCVSIMPTSERHVNCVFCHSLDTVSPYYS